MSGGIQLDMAHAAQEPVIRDNSLDFNRFFNLLTTGQDTPEWHDVLGQIRIRIGDAADDAMSSFFDNVPDLHRVGGAIGELASKAGLHLIRQ